VPPILVEVNHQLESRMREIRQSGSEGGGANPIVSPYPYSRGGAGGKWAELEASPNFRWGYVRLRAYEVREVRVLSQAYALRPGN
jgi:hypothetical protein